MAKRILVPLDRSAASEALLPLIADAARGAGATVRLLHVAPVPGVVESDYGRVVADSERAIDRADAAGQNYLEGAGASLQGIPVERVVRFGEPAHEILIEAEAWGADLVALTATPASPFRRLVRRGGIADRVARGAEVPVVLYRPRRNRRHPAVT